MGIFSALRVRDRADDLQDSIQASAATAAIVDPSTYPIATPFSSSTLQRIVFEDIFGADLPCNTRTAAMRLGPIARSRNLFASQVIQLQLIGLAGAEPLAEQPAWLTSGSGGTSPQMRNVWTFDDHFFYGWSCWWRDNEPDGYPAAVGRVNMGDWTVNDDNKVEIDGEEVPDNRVILIPGIHEGILSFGRDVLDDARTLARNVRQRIANPIPAVDLHQTTGEPLNETDRDALIAVWTAARQGTNGGVGYTSPNIEVNELGMSADAQLMIEARNAAAVDLARIAGVHAGMVDATAPKASLNYETQTGRNQEFVDFDLSAYLLPIAVRLSMDDCCRPGERVAFDLSDYTAPAPSPTGPKFED